MKPAHDFETVERLAAQLCAMAGGNWERKRTKRNVWRLRYRIGGLSAELHAINDTLKRVYG